eukprot:scaffold6516_cov71-Phaeocystis_antarctica.AAC.2
MSDAEARASTSAVKRYQLPVYDPALPVYVYDPAGNLQVLAAAAAVPPRMRREEEIAARLAAKQSEALFCDTPHEHLFPGAPPLRRDSGGVARTAPTPAPAPLPAAPAPAAPAPAASVPVLPPSYAALTALCEDAGRTLLLQDVCAAEYSEPRTTAEATAKQPEGSGTAMLGLKASAAMAAASLGRGQNNTTRTPEQQAIHVALSRIQLAHTEVEVCKVARTLAYALGTTRAEVATIRALHAVLLQLLRPGMSDYEAWCSRTAASETNFLQWKRRVKRALDPVPVV